MRTLSGNECYWEYRCVSDTGDVHFCQYAYDDGSIYYEQCDGDLLTSNYCEAAGVPRKKEGIPWTHGIYPGPDEGPPFPITKP